MMRITGVTVYRLLVQPCRSKMGADRGPVQHYGATLGNNFLSLKRAEWEQGNPFPIYSALPAEERFKILKLFKNSRF